MKDMSFFETLRMMEWHKELLRQCNMCIDELDAGRLVGKKLDEAWLIVNSVISDLYEFDWEIVANNRLNTSTSRSIENLKLTIFDARLMIWQCLREEQNHLQKFR